MSAFSTPTTKDANTKGQEPRQNTTADLNDTKGPAGGTREQLSKRQRLKSFFKSPAVESYEKNVSRERKDWGTGNQFGGGPYRPLSTTPGAADYYAAKGASGR
ncbi:hypothetical protein PFICI_07841 [Pestalotiopsis fici W106-1]|uniref:Uncharacterized protein n=1 Tax=Pestalotiopsis fici (strain W106-1 / CGMCC3.15140) TaxID=1229662 RepID=W3X4K6_PESFW|nr:uncharacterized protein PFICI_07841 [Pestalotiopsis fici W106-1]ETS80312.1 hypothetical protein PFICI_07841 [Pestalotiopsis fici W106-1]